MVPCDLKKMLQIVFKNEANDSNGEVVVHEDGRIIMILIVDKVVVDHDVDDFISDFRDV